MRLIDAYEANMKLIELYNQENNPAAKAALRAAMQVITNAPATPSLPNDPLTMKELREMDGEPVWVERPGYGKKWALVQVWAKSSNIVYLTYNNGSRLSQLQVELDCGAKVYRRKPEGGNSNA